MLRLALVAVAAAAAAVTQAPTAARAASSPLVVHATVSPGWSYFGDSVRARLDVLFDPRRVDATSVQSSPTFGIWQQFAPTEFSETRNAKLVHETWWFTLDCITFSCLPKGPAVQELHLPKLAVSARGTDGASLVVHEAWPPIRVAARFRAPALPTVRPVFRLETAVPPATYRIRPGLLALVLDLVGAILITGALAVVALGLWRRFAPSRRPLDEEPLQRALTLVHEARGREPDDRRRAVGLLARMLESTHGDLALSASALAWSAEEPSAAQLDALAHAIETEGNHRGGGER